MKYQNANSKKPQKSKKHKKMKAIDPFYVGDRTADLQLGKSNLKPKNLEQEFSRSAKEFSILKSHGKVKIKKQHKKQPAEDSNENLSAMERGISRPFIPVPDFVRKKGEKERNFMQRVESETHALIQKTQFEDKYQLNEDDMTEKELKEKEKDMQTKLERLKKKKERLKNRKQKLSNKKLEKWEDKHTGFESLKDNVSFGEVAMQPPTLPTLPRRAVKKSKFNVKSLLLHEMTSSSSTDGRTDDQETTSKTSNTSEELDRERQRAIALYRQIKSRKQQIQGLKSTTLNRSSCFEPKF